jgi:hypothetical protein
MKINLDVVNFEQEMKKVKKDIGKLAKAGIHEKIDYATTLLRKVTPVKTGKARRGWRNEKYFVPSVEKALNASEFSGVSQITSVAVALGGATSLSNQEGIIINDVEYIDRLNQGHSKQAPIYFIEQVLTQVGILTPD